MAGVRDRSKVAVVDDPEARARRLLEELRLGSLRKAAGAVAAVAAEVDKIAPKVSALEASVRKGEKVAEKDVATDDNWNTSKDLFPLSLRLQLVSLLQRWLAPICQVLIPCSSSFRAHLHA
ncbi:hypothetical protein TRIUR3_12256 [Triticum urartu]|uniref:Uncharacterized protein n=1 Tax=Triticum urartu TaxID=4572 RepID=M8ADZ2_TRIUA|nr:hypothetical protein TRIUR3_12256 [Triticum urartu]